MEISSSLWNTQYCAWDVTGGFPSAEDFTIGRGDLAVTDPCPQATKVPPNWNNPCAEGKGGPHTHDLSESVGDPICWTNRQNGSWRDIGEQVCLKN